jgi:hypothetical protein
MNSLQPLSIPGIAFNPATKKLIFDVSQANGIEFRDGFTGPVLSSMGVDNDNNSYLRLHNEQGSPRVLLGTSVTEAGQVTGGNVRVFEENGKPQIQLGVNCQNDKKDAPYGIIDLFERGNFPTVRISSNDIGSGQIRTYNQHGDLLTLIGGDPSTPSV